MVSGSVGRGFAPPPGLALSSYFHFFSNFSEEGGGQRGPFLLEFHFFGPGLTFGGPVPNFHFYSGPFWGALGHFLGSIFWSTHGGRGLLSLGGLVPNFHS